MSEKEIKEMIEGLKAYKRKITSSKKASREFLIRLGLVDEMGNLKEPYKPLCTQ